MFFIYRTLGPLKEEYYQTGTTNRYSHRRAFSDLPAMQQTSGQLQTERPDVLPISPGPSDAVDVPQSELRETTLRRKDSVARMTWDGLSYVVAVSVILCFHCLVDMHSLRRLQLSQVSRENHFFEQFKFRKP